MEEKWSMNIYVAFWDQITVYHRSNEERITYGEHQHYP